MGKLMRNGIDYSGVQVDETLNLMSKNPVENRAIKAAIDEKIGFEDIDSALSSTSENPVQNKVITSILGDIRSILEEVL